MPLKILICYFNRLKVSIKVAIKLYNIPIYLLNFWLYP